MFYVNYISIKTKYILKIIYNTHYQICIKLNLFSFLIVLFIYLFILAVLGVHCCTGFSPVVASEGYSLVAVSRLLIVPPSLIAELGLQGTQASVVEARGLSVCSSQALEHSLNSCGTLGQLLRGMWDLPEPVSCTGRQILYH